MNEHVDPMKCKLNLDHLNERNINDIWNQVMFEVKVIRDYFVDQTVIPKSTALDSNFFNLQHFVAKFIPGI